MKEKIKKIINFNLSFLKHYKNYFLCKKPINIILLYHRVIDKEYNNDFEFSIGVIMDHRISIKVKRHDKSGSERELICVSNNQKVTMICVPTHS